MADVLTKEQRSFCMSRIKNKNTQTELDFRRALWKAGLRYRLQGRLPGKPDLFLPKRKVAVFIDGCFWHGCRKHSHLPKSNLQYWEKKLARNKARDRRITQELRRDGWRVVRLWQHDLAREQAISARLLAALGRLSVASGKTRNTQ